MAIIAPTTDEFDEPTVMLIIRNLVKWIQTDLVPQINDNDVISANLDFDDESRKLSGTLIKGDGGTIDIEPVTIPGGSGTSIDYSIDSIEFTYQGNNLSCIITQKNGTQTTSNTVVIAGGGGTGGNPYPTAISGTVGEDGNITLTMTMSEGNPVTATINMSYFASAEDLENIQISTTVSQDSTNVIKIANAVNGNSADLTLDLSVVNGELILTAEDGTNTVVTKVDYNGGSTQTQIIGARSSVSSGARTLDSLIVLKTGDTYSESSLKYYSNNEEFITCPVFKNLYCAIIDNMSNTGGINYCCGYSRSTATAAQAQTKIYSANTYYERNSPTTDKVYGIPNDKLIYSAYTGYLKVTKCLPAKYCYDNSNNPLDLPDIIIKLENGIAVKAKFNTTVYVAVQSCNVYLTPLSEISISTEEPTFD